jgi:hypothetical protein
MTVIFSGVCVIEKYLGKTKPSINCEETKLTSVLLSYELVKKMRVSCMYVE